MEHPGTPAEHLSPCKYWQYDTGVPRSTECASEASKQNNSLTLKNNEKDYTNP